MRKEQMRAGSLSSLSGREIISICSIVSKNDTQLSVHASSPSVPENGYTVYTPCLKKLCKLIFCQNFVKFRPIVKIFGIKIAEKTSFSVVYSLSTSPNLCQHTSAFNTVVH